MNASKLLVILIACLTIPAPVAAQIIIDRYNEDVDPSRPVKKEEPKEEATGGDTEASEADTELTDDEVEKIKESLVKKLQRLHTDCVGKSKLFRAELATIQGSSTWTIDKDGNASPDGETTLTTENKEAFFVTDKMMKQMPPDRTEMVIQSAMAGYNECAAAPSLKTSVEGKEGSVQLTYTVTFSGKKAKVTAED